MFHPRFLRFSLCLIILGTCLLQQQECFAVPVKYTNVDYKGDVKAAVSHLSTEGNINMLMEAQNALNGFPDYFSQSGFGQFIQDAASTIDGVESTVTETFDAAVGSATTITGAVTGAITGTANNVVNSVGDTVGGMVDSGTNYISGLFSSDEAGTEKAGSGFANIKTSASNVVNKINELNPIDRFLARDESEAFCENLKTKEGVSECFYLDNDKNLGMFEVGDIHEHVAKGQSQSIANLYADSATVINSTANFQKVEEDTNNETPRTVSETLTKRAESDLAFNVIGGTYFGLDLSTLELNSLTIYNTINAIKVDGGFF